MVDLDYGGSKSVHCVKRPLCEPKASMLSLFDLLTLIPARTIFLAEKINEKKMSLVNNF